MAVEILTDRPKRIECFYCTTTEHAFGPIMEWGDGYLFLDWLEEASAVYGRIRQPSLIGDGTDPRDYSPDHLEEIYKQFKAEQAHEWGEGPEPDGQRYLGEGRWGATT